MLVCALCAALAAGTAACADREREAIRQPVEGKFEILWDVAMGLSPTVHFIQPLQAAFPETTFYYMTTWRTWQLVDEDALRRANRSGELYSHLLVSYDNKPADLIVFEHILAADHFSSGYLEPLDDYVAADLTIRERLDPDLLERVRAQGNGRLYALPFAKNVYALYYNKDIFDRFGVPYPTDGMTWDDVFALAREISDILPHGEKILIGPDNRFLNISEISAFGLADRHLAFSQMGGRFPDPETGPPDFREPVWDRYAAFLEELSALRSPSLFNTYKSFGAGNVAMVAGRLHGSQHYSGAGSEATDLLMAPFAEWDMVSFPVFPDAPDTGPAPAYYYVGIPKNSLHKQEAFRLISHLLSDEVQLENSKNGLASVRGDPAFREAFAERTYKASGKHVEAFLHHPKEADLGPHYDIYLQYSMYQSAWNPAADQLAERFYTAHDYTELGEFRQWWRELLAGRAE